MMSAALENGGRDNVSIVVVDVLSVHQPEEDEQADDPADDGGSTD